MQERGNHLKPLISNFIICFMIIFAFSAFAVFSCATKKAIVQDSIVNDKRQNAAVADNQIMINPQKPVFRSPIINAALINFSVTNKPDFQLQSALQSYKNDVGLNSDLRKAFPPEKVETLSSSNLIAEISVAVKEKGVGTVGVSGDGENSGLRRLKDSEIDALLRLLRIGIMKNPKDVGVYFSVNALLGGLIMNESTTTNSKFDQFSRENFAYGVVMNRDDSYVLGILLPGYLGSAKISKNEQMTIWEDLLRYERFFSTRKHLYAQMLMVYADEGDLKGYLNLVEKIQKEDNPTLTYFQGQLIPIIFEGLNVLKREDLIIKLWEEKYKNLYLEKMDRGNKSQSSSYYVAMKSYGYALKNTGKKDKAIKEAQALHNLGLSLTTKDIEKVIEWMKR